MTAREMNIDISQGIQKIAANSTRKFLPEEIDWLANKMVGRFVKSAVRLNEMGYYELNERYAQALAPLKCVNTPLSVELTATNQYTALMPADFTYIVSPGVNVAETCNSTISHTNQSWSTYGIKLMTSKSSALYWATWTVTFADGTTLSQADVPGWTGYKSKEEQFSFATVLTEELWARGINVYWETLADLYRTGYILYQAESPIITAMTIDGTVVSPVTINTFTKVVPSATVTSLSGLARVVKSEFVHRFLSSPYTTTAPRSPIIEESSLGRLTLYTDSSFIVSGLQTTYIRKPRKIDVRLHRGCDLHPDFHEEVCDMAIVHIKNLLSDPSWQAKVQENTLQQIL